MIKRYYGLPADEIPFEKQNTLSFDINMAHTLDEEITDAEHIYQHGDVIDIYEVTFTKVKTIKLGLKAEGVE